MMSIKVWAAGRRDELAKFTTFLTRLDLSIVVDTFVEFLRSQKYYKTLCNHMMPIKVRAAGRRDELSFSRRRMSECRPRSVHRPSAGKLIVKAVAETSERPHLT